MLWTPAGKVGGERALTVLVHVDVEVLLGLELPGELLRVHGDERALLRLGDRGAGGADVVHLWLIRINCLILRREKHVIAVSPQFRITSRDCIFFEQPFGQKNKDGVLR